MILSATLRHVVYSTGQLSCNNPDCINICPPITSIEEKQREASMKEVLCTGKKQTHLKSLVILTLKSWSQMLFRKMQKKVNKIQMNGYKLKSAEFSRFD